MQVIPLTDKHAVNYKFRTAADTRAGAGEKEDCKSLVSGYKVSRFNWLAVGAR